MNTTHTITIRLDDRLLARIDKLIALLTHGMTDEDVAAVIARLKSFDARLKDVAADPNVPPV